MRDTPPVNHEEALTAMDRSHKELAELLFGGMSERQFASFTRGLDHVLARLHEALR